MRLDEDETDVLSRCDIGAVISISIDVEVNHPPIGLYSVEAHVY